MPILHIILLALIQGVTEFLPVSSSGHLLIFHKIASAAPGQDAEKLHLLTDIAVHVGTLIAVCIYFRKDVAKMIGGIAPFLIGDWLDRKARLNLRLIVSSIPVIAAGLALHIIDPVVLRQTWVVAASTIIFGLALWHADEKYPRASRDRSDESMTLREALYIGLAQMLALIPGTSRSGITMTASRYLGFSRTHAAKYSLLLSIIAISGAGTLGALGNLDLITKDALMTLSLAALLSCLAALAAIAFMMRWLANQSFRIFAIYRIFLGAILMVLMFVGIL